MGVVAALCATTPAEAGGDPQAAQVQVTETTRGGGRSLSPMADLRFSATPSSGLPVIKVGTRARFQSIRGFGAALTDSSAWLIHDRLGKTTRTRLLHDLFAADGLHLQFLRLPMGGSDFTAGRRPYTYDDLPPGRRDPQLRSFSISHDRAYIIPTALKALWIDPRIEILATPWTPPPWMKTNQAFDNTAASGRLLPSAYAPLARYFVKFIRAYAAAGIRITAITPQNEPDGQSLFPGLKLPWATQAMWITRYLRPALRAAGLHTKIYTADVGWNGEAYQVAVVRHLTPGAITGVAWHCYNGSPAVMHRLHVLAPKLDQVVSECATQITPLTVPELISQSLRYGASTVALWNLALTPSGGPVQPPDSGCRGCRGLVTVNPTTHATAYTREYYQLGQFSRFISRGAKRVGSTQTGGIDDVAVRNPDGSFALVVYNASRSTSKFAVEWNHEYLTYALPSRATATLVWQGR
jgi:glucosylceramidase